MPLGSKLSLEYKIVFKCSLCRFDVCSLCSAKISSVWRVCLGLEWRQGGNLLPSCAQSCWEQECTCVLAIWSSKQRAGMDLRRGGMDPCAISGETHFFLSRRELLLSLSAPCPPAMDSQECLKILPASYRLVIHVKVKLEGHVEGGSSQCPGLALAKTSSSTLRFGTKSSSSFSSSF